MTRKEMLQKLENGADLLDLAIQKWQNIVLEIGIDEGVDNCALCEVYTLEDGACTEECPIMADTNRMGCKGTPYPSSNDNGRAMLEYLKSLKIKSI